MDADDALGRTWTDDRPRALLTELTAIGGRLGGSEGEARAATVVADALREAGVEDVCHRPFETAVWERGSAGIELSGVGRPLGGVALPYSPAGEVTAPVVDAGHGLPWEIDDVEGAVVVADTDSPPDERFVHRMESYGAAVEGGAVGFAFANHHPGQLPPTGALRFGREAATPGVGVSRETGAWLRECADDGGTARLAVDAETRRGESQNVIGRLGPATDRELLVVAHYDGHDVGEGALDNACGVATLVAAARILAEADLDRGVRVAALGCEETGLLGAEALAGRLDLDSVSAVVNVDGAGRFRDMVAMTHGSGAIEDVVDGVAERSRHPIGIRDRPHPFSDHWPFLRRGVPALQLHSDSGERGRGWTHTAADTREKVDDRNVREHAMLTALIVADLAAAVPPRIEPAALADRLRDAQYEPGMRAAGLWPDGWD